MMPYVIVLFCYINLLHYICAIKMMCHIKTYQYEEVQLIPNHERRS